MQVDRRLQKEILIALKEIYPRSRDINVIYRAVNRSLPGWDSGKNDPHDHLLSNIFYLREHGLVDGQTDSLSPFDKLINITVTKSGIDFIENDGGLTAILGVVTVRLHAETMNEIENWILASDQPAEEKTRLLDRLRMLPEEGARTLVQELVKAGLSNAPGAWHTILGALT